MEISELMHGLLEYFIFLVSTSLHEFAHAWSAKKGGDETAYRAGLMTIDPLPHIKNEPLGMILLPLFGLLTVGTPLGFAHIPYSSIWARKYPYREAIMSLSGPLANLLISVVSFIVMVLGVNMGYFGTPEIVNMTSWVSGFGSVSSTCALIASIAFHLNLALFVFNILPLPPLDGSGILSIFSSKLGQLSFNPFFKVAGFLIASELFPVLFKPVFKSSISLFDYFIF